MDEVPLRNRTRKAIRPNSGAGDTCTHVMINR